MSAALVNGYQIHSQEFDCVYEPGVILPMAPLVEGGDVVEGLGERVLGRTLAADVNKPGTETVLTDTPAGTAEQNARVGTAYREAGEALLEHLISGDIALLGEVAGDDAEIGIGVVGGDVGEGGIEAGEGIEAPEQLSRRHQVKIGDVDELHGLSCLSREPRSRPAASAMG